MSLIVFWRFFHRRRKSARIKIPASAATPPRTLPATVAASGPFETESPSVATALEDDGCALPTPTVPSPVWVDTPQEPKVVDVGLERVVVVGEEEEEEEVVVVVVEEEESDESTVLDDSDEEELKPSMENEGSKVELVLLTERVDEEDWVVLVTPAKDGKTGEPDKGVDVKGE